MMLDGPYPVRFDGPCPICEAVVPFVVWGSDFRNQFLCEGCRDYSVPRERALARVVKRLFPDWRDRAIHETSPVDRGFSAQMKRSCAGYVATQFYPGEPLGIVVGAFRNENIERSTFPDETFDIVVSQDVLEHVDDFAAAIRDTMRTVRPGGAHVFTTPTMLLATTVQWATYVDGRIRWFFEPEYHGNPIDESGSPVTWHYGYDLPDLIHRRTGFAVEVARIHDPASGIAGPMNEVYVVRKPADRGSTGG